MDGFPPSEQVETLIEEGVWSLSGSQHTDRGDRKKLPPVKPELVIRTTFSGRFKTLAQGYGKSSRNWEGDWVGLAHGIQMRTSSVAGRTVRAVAVTITAWLVVSMLAVGSSAATTASFSAVGSAGQVYVTGLAPSAQASLITAHGQTFATQTADSLGGLLFRNVPPGGGYRVLQTAGGARSGPLRVHSNAAAPW